MISSPKRRSKRDVTRDIADVQETRNVKSAPISAGTTTAIRASPRMSGTHLMPVRQPRISAALDIGTDSSPRSLRAASAQTPVSVKAYTAGSDALSRKFSRVSTAADDSKRSRHERKSDIIGAATVEKLINRLFFSGRSANDAKEFLQLLDIRAPESADIGYKWQMSVIRLEEQYGRRFPFAFIGFYLLKPLVVPIYCKENTLIRFLHSLSRLYLDNPYHNDSHAGAVAHKTVSLIRLLNFESALSDLDMATVIVASLGHDAGHFARTNNFVQESRDPLSLMYNDDSILENYHAYLTFSVLTNKASDIFVQLTAVQFKHVRKMIIDLILTTDMAAHFATVKNFSERAISTDFDPRSNERDKWMLLQMCLKMADIGHAALEWRDHCSWSARLAEELYDQGVEEAALGFPITPLCDRSRQHLFHTDQIGFLKYVVMPLCRAISIADSTNNINHVINKRVKKNMEHWRLAGEQSQEKSQVGDA